jgi:putative ABC transport system permease protein
MYKLFRSWSFRSWCRSDSDPELDAELAFHLQELIDEFVASGVSHEEARRRALLTLGNPERVREQVREMSWLNYVMDLGRDISFATRSLRGAGRAGIVAVLALALGIGFSTTVFSIVYNGVLHPFPYRSADRLATISIADGQRGIKYGRGMFTPEEILAFRRETRVFEDVAGYGTWYIRYTYGSAAEILHGGALTPNAMAFFGMQPILGRAFSDHDSQPGAPPVVLLNYLFWKERFHQDPGVIGTTMILGGRPRTVVGVMPPRFQLLGSDLYLPVPWQSSRPLEENKPDYFFANALVRRDVSLKAAGADLDVVVRQLLHDHPRDFPDHPVSLVRSWSDALFQDYKRMFLLLAAAVGLLLMISCSNAAGLLLVHASSRSREMAVRSALGAGRARLARQFLAESMVLAAAGYLLGCIFTALALHWLSGAWMARYVLCMEADVTLNRSTLLLAGCLSFVATVAAGLAPSIVFLRGNLQQQLGSNGQGVHTSFHGAKFRSALVVGQVALSVVLLVSAGLTMRSFVALTHIDFGIRATNLLSSWISFPKGSYETAEQKKQYVERLLTRLDQLPGVVNASVSLGQPLYGGPISDVTIPGKPHGERWETMFDACSASYFETLGLQLLRGRLLSSDDVATGRHVAVINQTLARRYFGAEDPIGKEIRFNLLDDIPETPHNLYFSIIGVVSDFTNAGIEKPPMPEAFLPHSFTGFGGRGVLVRTAVDPNALLNSMRRAMWDLDPRIVLSEPLALEDYLARNSYAKPRFGVVAFGVCALVGLLLSLIGIFTVTAYTVSLLTHEIGIRMAFGAQRSDVLNLVLSKGLRLVVAGIMLGLVASLLLVPVLHTQLWGVSMFDGFTFLIVALLLLATGMLASYLPALRAMRVDPNSALRCE